MTTLDTVLGHLEALAPLSLAADWDNVGLLVEPVGREAPVRRVLLTIDLTAPVFAEALARSADLIVAYHPIIFGGWKRLDRGNAQRRTVIDALRSGIAIYCPHTALDAVPGGVCDWLIEAVGSVIERAPIEPSSSPAAPIGAGMGRIGALEAPTELDALIPRIKAHLGLEHLRVARPAAADTRPIERVAVCPGAGGSLFGGVRGVDLLITGEMRHHDVLARVAAGTTVVLTDHTHCERGYLTVLEEKLAELCGPGVEIIRASTDDDPLRVI